MPMFGWHTIFLVPPVSVTALARATCVLAVFLLTHDMQGGGQPVGFAPITAAFWVYIVWAMFENAPKLRRLVCDRDVSAATVVVSLALVLALMVTIASRGPAAVGEMWVCYFAIYGALMLWVSLRDTGVLARHWGIDPKFASLEGQIQAITLAVMAAALAALGHPEWHLAFVAVATFGWLAVQFVGNWIAVLILIDADENLDL